MLSVCYEIPVETCNWSPWYNDDEDSSGSKRTSSESKGNSERKRSSESGSPSGSKGSHSSDGSSGSGGSSESRRGSRGDSSEEPSSENDSSRFGRGRYRRRPRSSSESEDSDHSDSISSSRKKDKGYDELELLEDAKQDPNFPENCNVPTDIQCRTVDSHIFANQTGDDVTCEADTGLKCRDKNRRHKCQDYEVRYLCCVVEYIVVCETTPGI